MLPLKEMVPGWEGWRGGDGRWLVGLWVCVFLRKPENKKGNITFPETKIAPETLGLEDFFSFWEGLFSGVMLVAWRLYYTVNQPVSCEPGRDLHLEYGRFPTSKGEEMRKLIG